MFIAPAVGLYFALRRSATFRHFAPTELGGFAPKKSYVTNSAMPSDVRKRSALPFHTVKILGLRPENWA